MIFTLISLGAFSFGALAFAGLAVTWWVERLRGRARRSGVLPWFTLVCALSFAFNLLGLGWPLSLAAGLVPPLLLHVAAQQYGVRARWLLPPLYAAAVAAALLPGDAFENAPVLVLAACAAAALALSLRAPASRYRTWTRVLFALLLAAAAASLWQAEPWVTLAPDYLVLVFFAVTLYYRERLIFFDLFLKRGAFFALGLIVLSLYFALRTTPQWMDALLLAPLWVAAPWIYGRMAGLIDRLWLGRPYSRAAAERRFIRAVQAAASEAQLDEAALRALREIFQTEAAIAAGEIALAPRADGAPLLSEEESLRQSLSHTLAVVRENVRFREREQELRLAAGRAELKALRAQINPHFLFNALNAIAGLIHTRPELAEETVERLSEVFRYALRGASREWVKLEEEMEFVAACLGVEQARFGDRLAVEIAIAPEARAARVPAMCVQPLVENAVKHGTGQRQGQGRVAVRARVADGRLEVEVTDNGPGFPQGFRLAGAEGHGLRNIAGRLSGYYGDAARLAWENLPEGARVRLEMPCAY